MKDNFSHNSAQYAQFRPSYPKEVFAFLDSILENRGRVWDCATGNGQVAKELIHIFEHVEATDLSENQLKNAFSHPKISYSCQVAEQTNFPDSYFDCVTVGQAIHWFDFEKFNTEVKRVLKPGGLVVYLGYGNSITQNQEVQELVVDLYEGKLIKYWDLERIHIDEEYRTIPFPYEVIESPTFEARYHWTKEQLLGYLNTWSGLKHYRDKTGEDPMIEFEEKLPNFETVEILFPTLLKIGKLKN